MRLKKIIASGKRDREKMLVEIEDGVTYIDAVENDSYDGAIYEQHPIGGTYYAEADSMENALNTLGTHFFDEAPKITTIGDFEEIPYEDGRIY